MNKVESYNKIKELVEGINIAMLVTENGRELRSRPMYTAGLADDFSLYFFTNKHSGKAEEIEQQQSVNLAFANPKKQEYLSISGQATLVEDDTQMDELWKPMMKAWYPDGLNDPNLILLRVIPTTAEFWDTSSNRLVQLFEIGKAIITNSVYDGGKHETVKF